MRFLLALFWLTVLTEIAAAQSVEEYQALRWGMTRDEVKAAYPAMSEGVSRYDSHKRAMIEGFGLANIHFAGCKANFYLDFGRQGLQETGFSHIKSGKDVCASSFRLTLIRRFGLDYLSMSASMFGPVDLGVVTEDSWTGATWISGDNEITLTDYPGLTTIRIRKQTPWSPPGPR